MPKISVTEEPSDANPPVDQFCLYQDEFDPETSIFRSEKYHEFFKSWFGQNCLHQNACTIDPSVYLISEVPEDEFDPENLNQPLSLLHMLSDTCLFRIIN